MLAGTFGSVEKMLSGKKYHQKFRALRIVAQELLRPIELEEGVSSFSGLMAALDRHAARSRTATLMMTSSNGNIFRVTGPLCGEFTGPGDFPAQRPVTRSFDVSFDLRPNKRLSKQT